MNQLNSVIFEGIVSDRSCWQSDDRTEYRCVVSSIRTRKVDGKREEQRTDVEVYASDKVAQACDTHLTDGRGIRVVGRLGMHGNGQVVVFAEHVEFKPVYKEITNG